MGLVFFQCLRSRGYNMSIELYPNLLSDIYFIGGKNEDEKIEVVRKSISSIYDDLVDCIQCNQCNCNFASDRFGGSGSYIVMGMYNGGVITRTLKDTLSLNPDEEDDDYYLFRSYGQLDIDCSLNPYRDDRNDRNDRNDRDDRHSKIVSHLRSIRNEFLSKIFADFLERLSDNGYLRLDAIYTRFDKQKPLPPDDLDGVVPF